MSTHTEGGGSPVFLLFGSFCETRSAKKSASLELVGLQPLGHVIKHAQGRK